MLAGGKMSDSQPIKPGSVLSSIAAAFGEQPGFQKRTPKQRRDYTARELAEMADNALQGIPPATSPARAMIAVAQLAGDFERANALIREVKEKAIDLRRMARAAERAERRAAKRARGHIHICNTEQCSEEGMGPCRCECGAVLVMGPTYSVDGRWVWQLTDGTFAPFPDPREAEHPRARR